MLICIKNREKKSQIAARESKIMFINKIYQASKTASSHIVL